MSKEYEELVEAAAQKISERSRREFDFEEFLNNLYKMFSTGKVAFTTENVENAVKDLIGEAGIDCLGIRIENVYSALKFRMSTPNEC